MTPDTDVSKIDFDREINNRLPQLPKNISNYIEKLKKKNNLYKILFRTETSSIPEEDAKSKLEAERNTSLKHLLISNNREEQALGALKLTWILSLTNEMSNYQWERSLYQIHTIWKDQIILLKTEELVIVPRIYNLVREASLN